MPLGSIVEGRAAVEDLVRGWPDGRIGALSFEHLAGRMTKPPATSCVC